jgi:hypothetical protein
MEQQYVSFLVGDLVLCNCMLDFGDNNIMPYGVMRNLRLKVTRPYQNVYAIDSMNVELW